MSEIDLHDVKKKIEKSKLTANAYFRSVVIFTTFYVSNLYLGFNQCHVPFLKYFLMISFLPIPFFTFELIKAIRVIEYCQKNALYKILIDDTTTYIIYDSKRTIECKNNDFFNLKVFETGSFFKINRLDVDCVILKNDTVEFIISKNELETIKKELGLNFIVNKSFLKWYDFIYYTPFLIKTENGTSFR